MYRKFTADQIGEQFRDNFIGSEGESSKNGIEI